jgi:hypothetical protein
MATEDEGKRLVNAASVVGVQSSKLKDHPEQAEIKTPP